VAEDRGAAAREGSWLQHERRRAVARLPSLPIVRVITEVLNAFLRHASATWKSEIQDSNCTSNKIV